MSDPPLPDPIVDHLSRNPRGDQFHHHTQRLDIFVPALVVEEEHLLVRDARALVQVRKVGSFVSGEDF